jgi:hypothetical protein
MVTNEQTSESVASYASELLRMERPFGVSETLWKKIQSVAGSALTQAPDKSGLMSVAQHYAALAVASQKLEHAKRRENDGFLAAYWKARDNQ